MSIGTLLFTWLHGKRVGSDAVGNAYFEERRARAGMRQRRWVLYRNGPVEASRVPPEWHAWLHHITASPLPGEGRRAWVKPHQPNPTGTGQGYRPPGHDYSGGARAAGSGDYQAWTPEG